MPYIITIASPPPPPDYSHSGNVITRRAVVALTQRWAFDGDEWRAAGFDQPDGNLQFWHPVLILSQSGTGREETAEILWLHNGRVSKGHFVNMLGMPGYPTRADRERFPSWPDQWPITEIPSTIGPLPDGTKIEVAHVEWRNLIEGYGPPDSETERAEIIDAYNKEQT